MYPHYEREELRADTELASDDRKDRFNEQPLKCNQEMDPKPTSAREPTLPSFYPSYFPYHAQHSIITTVQFHLELTTSNNRSNN